MGTLCSDVDLSSVGKDDNIWPYVSSLQVYDPLCLLVALPAALERFFEVEIKNVKGVEHMVIGVSEQNNGVQRDVAALKSFVLNALRYALTKSVDHARWQQVPA